MEDEDLKSEQFFKLYNSVSTRVLSYLVIMVHNKDDAEELLQETATVLWTKFDEYEEDTNFGAWAVSIARLKALEFFRERKKTRMVFDDTFYEKVSDQAKELSGDLPVRIEALKNCIDKLSVNQKKLLSLRFRKDLAIKKISQLTGRPLGSLYHSFSRMIIGLRNCVEKQLIQNLSN
jgi:RNA polymerase sigma-70 factor (ECF subfamily)